MRLLWLGAATFTGVLIGLCIAAGDYVAVIWAAVLLVGVGALSQVVSGHERRRDLLALAICAAALHMAVGLGIQAVSTTFAGGFVTGDDAAYYRLSSAFARYVQGLPLDPAYAPPLWGGEGYLFGAFVYLETGLFLIFGADVRIPILLNSALAIVAALLIFDTTQRVFGRTAGLVAATIVAFIPSLILWSALNLKDSLTITLAVLAVWAAVQFQYRARPLYFVLQFATAQALISLRSYVAGTIALALFVSVALTALPWRRRLAATALAGILAAFVIVQSLNTIGVSAGQQLLEAFERERAAMAVGARTGFVPTPAPAPAPAAEAPHPGELAPAAGRTLTYLPIGLAYAIFAPVPLLTEGRQELAVAPEMLVWYVLVGASVATLWRERRRWAALAPLVLAVGGIVLVLALAEGNIGTLFRHRAMVIPFAAALAGPSLVALWARRRSWTVRGRHLLVLDAAVMAVMFAVAVRLLGAPLETLWMLPLVVLVRLATLILTGSYGHEGALAGRKELTGLVVRFAVGDALAYAGVAALVAFGLVAVPPGLALLDSILALAALGLYRSLFAAAGLQRHALLAARTDETLDLASLPATLTEMLDAFRAAPRVYQPSRFWDALNTRHLRVLSSADGLRTFKRTLNTSYFQFGIGAFFGALPILVLDWLRHPDASVLMARIEGGPHARRGLAIATALYANAVRHRPHGDLLDRITEPAMGDPILVRLGHRLVTEDLCHSVEEYASVIGGLPPAMPLRRAMELGAGYGRLAYAFLRARPDLRYYVVDIPPALYVSQRYLTSVLPDVPAFLFRPFTDHAQVAAEMDEARLVFLEPQQLELLPDDQFDLVLTVSTLHEMRPDQVDRYFELADRLCRGAFYTKQWRRFYNDVDDVTVSMDDLPVPARWRRVFERKPIVPRSFREALYLCRADAG